MSNPYMTNTFQQVYWRQRVSFGKLHSTIYEACMTARVPYQAVNVVLNVQLPVYLFTSILNLKLDPKRKH